MIRSHKGTMDFLCWHRRRFGLFATAGPCASLLAGRSDIVPVDNPHDPAHPLLLRASSVDRTVYDEIMVHDEYRVMTENPRFIIDAGAHIGLASVYFACRYPRATIVSLEPDEENFSLLVQNTAAYPNVRPLRAGLWSSRTKLRITNTGAATWSFRVEEDPAGGEIEAFGIRDLLSRAGFPRIDILKMDIEGSEKAVLETSGDWIDLVSVFIIELHDRYTLGCTVALADALEGRGFTGCRSGESLVFTSARSVGGTK